MTTTQSYIQNATAGNTPFYLQGSLSGGTFNFVPPTPHNLPYSPYSFTQNPVLTYKNFSTVYIIISPNANNTINQPFYDVTYIYVGANNLYVTEVGFGILLPNALKINLLETSATVGEIVYNAGTFISYRVSNGSSHALANGLISDYGIFTPFKSSSNSFFNPQSVIQTNPLSGGYEYLNTLSNIPNISPYNDCSGSYALCTSASCIQDSNETMLCTCPIYNGLNISAGVPCAQLSATGDNPGDIIYSTYSGIGISDNLSQVTCNDGAWGDCLNQPCIIQQDGSALCSCPIVTKISPWVTYQNSSLSTNPSTCNYLSGAISNAASSINTYYQN